MKITLDYVVDSLQRTISNKEFLLGDYQLRALAGDSISSVMVKMLEINIDELKRILADLQALEN